jgi:transcriptional regulator with XRE-family HTH domain
VGRLPNGTSSVLRVPEAFRSAVREWTHVSTGTDHGGADLGRRIAEHRRQAGLTREGAAERAGIAAEYLEYLETSPAPDATRASVARLAAVLGTTRSALSGARLELPAGQQAALDRPVLEKLTASECRAYLGSSGVGRFCQAGV